MNPYSKYSKYAWGLLGVAIGTALIIGGTMGRLNFDQIINKLNSIIVPKPPIGNLTPTRDLRGTWKSSLTGKGLQLYGVIKAGPSVTTVTEDGDVEMIIDSVENNIARGKIRYTNLKITGVTTAPKIKPVTIKQSVQDSGELPLTIRVSANSLDFGSQTVNGVAITMQGTYTTDIMSGSMSAIIPSYGVIKGVFHLSRKW
jgi:hypothetical protein